MYALFYRIKYPKDSDTFRDWKFSGFESAERKIAQFIFDVEAENGKDSVRIFDMNTSANVITDAGRIESPAKAAKENEARQPMGANDYLEEYLGSKATREPFDGASTFHGDTP